MKPINVNENEEKKKKGFLPFLSRIFGGSRTSSSLGGVAGSAGRTVLKGGLGAGKGFWASLVTSKAGVVGLLLGAATIATGIGLIYNYISPSSGKLYAPSLFSDAYYQDVQRQANAERANAMSPTDSSLEKFMEAARKELASEEALQNKGKEEESVNKSQESSTEEGGQSNAASEEPPSPQAPSQNKSQGKSAFQPNLGFAGGGAGGGGSGAPKLQTSGGLWNNLGAKFSPPKTQGAGKSDKIRGSYQARLISAPKYSVGGIKKKGTFGQAKFAGNVSKGAMNLEPAGARATAEQAFSGQTAGSGDVAAPIGGAGLGGAGLGQGQKFPQPSSYIPENEIQPPTPGQKNDEAPWKKLTDYALYLMIAAAGFIAIASLLANHARSLMILNPAAAIGWFTAAKYMAYLAIVAAIGVIGVGLALAFKYDQKMMGLMYTMIGGVLIYQAIKALQGINEGLDKAKNVKEFQDKLFKENPALKEQWEKLDKISKGKNMEQWYSDYSKNPNGFNWNVEIKK